MTFENALPDASQSSIIHWHGMHTPAAVDGHPDSIVKPGERYVYEFTVADRAGTYWFHPHPHGAIGKQVVMGLAGLFLVSDEEEDAAGLPTGAQDIPVVRASGGCACPFCARGRGQSPESVGGSAGVS